MTSWHRWREEIHMAWNNSNQTPILSIGYSLLLSFISNGAYQILDDAIGPLFAVIGSLLLIIGAALAFWLLILRRRVEIRTDESDCSRQSRQI